MLAELDPDKPEDAHFTCPECGAIIEEHHLAEMIRAGKWVAGVSRPETRSTPTLFGSTRAPLSCKVQRRASASPTICSI
jgi:hypothetical protein